MNIRLLSWRIFSPYVGNYHAVIWVSFSRYLVYFSHYLLFKGEDLFPAVSTVIEPYLAIYPFFFALFLMARLAPLALIFAPIGQACFLLEGGAVWGVCKCLH